MYSLVALLTTIISLNLFLLASSALVSPSAPAFVCAGKVIGGYYADLQQGCQMFHVCTLDEKGGIRDITFRCLNGTVFDQETRVCEREQQVDCSIAETFYRLNNDLYGPGIIPDTASEIQRLPAITCHADDDSAVARADPQQNCRSLHLCIPQLNFSPLRRHFTCLDEGFAFSSSAECVPVSDVTCGTETPLLKLPVEEANMWAVFSVGLCGLLGKDKFVIDGRSECSQYIRCPSDPREVIGIGRCPPQMLFSQSEQRCLPHNAVSCRNDISKLFENIEVSRFNRLFNPSDRRPKLNFQNDANIENNFVSTNTQQEGIVVRRRRSPITLEDGNPEREASPGDLTKVASVFSDQVSVVEAQSPGNAVEGPPKTAPKLGIKDKGFGKENRKPSDKIVKGGNIEVNYLEGKVTIHSRVPSVSRQKANGKIDSSTHEVSATQEATLAEQEFNTTTEAGLQELNATVEVTTIIPDVEEVTQNITELGIVDATESSLDEATITPSVPSVKETVPPTSSPAPTSTTTSTLPPSSSSSSSSTSTSTTTITPQHETFPKVLNFTCKDKELEQFYPDLDKNCSLFHYCLPGFTNDQVLDLTFACSGNTKFDIKTKKCQDMETVVCGEQYPPPNEMPTGTTPSTTSSTIMSTPSTTTTTTAVPTTSSSSITLTAEGEEGKVSLSPNQAIIETGTAPSIQSTTISTEDVSLTVSDAAAPTDTSSLAASEDAASATETSTPEIIEEDSTSPAVPTSVDIKGVNILTASSEFIDTSSASPTTSTSSTLEETSEDMNNTLITDTVDGEVMSLQPASTDNQVTSPPVQP